jgi:hypothetical protein
MGWREVAEIVSHRQRGGSEDPGARVIGHLLAEKLGRGQRRDVQLHRVLENLHPAHLARHIRLAHPHQRVQRGGSTAFAGLEAFAAPGLGCQRFFHLMENLA